MTTSLIDLTNRKCWENNIPTHHSSHYVPHSNINEMSFYHKETKQLIAKFHCINDVWTLVETNYPEFYV